MFVVPALLGRAGYPPPQAAYAINSLYQVASFALVTLIAATLVPRHAVALGCILQLLPIAFVFRVRANQEYAVLAALLLAVYATERACTRPAWIAGMLAGFCGVLLVKGVFAFMVPVACGLWVMSRAPSNARPRQDWAAWTGLALMPIAGAIVTPAYEAAYVNVTGRSFLEIYRSRQLPEDALGAGSLLRRVAYTASWYVARIVWYPVSVESDGHGRRGRLRAARAVVAVSQTVQSSDDRSAGWQGAWFAVVTALVLTATFSIAHRKADRYIFPVYFLIGAAGAGVALRRSEGLSRLASKLDRPWIPGALYLSWSCSRCFRRAGSLASRSGGAEPCRSFLLLSPELHSSWKAATQPQAGSLHNHRWARCAGRHRILLLLGNESLSGGSVMVRKSALILCALALSVATMAFAQTDTALSANVKTQLAADDMVKGELGEGRHRRSRGHTQRKRAESSCQGPRAPIARDTTGVTSVVDKLTIGEAAGKTAAQKAAGGVEKGADKSADAVGTAAHKSAGAVDKSKEKVGDAAEKTGEAVGTAAKATGKAVETAGEEDRRRRRGGRRQDEGRHWNGGREDQGDNDRRREEDRRSGHRCRDHDGCEDETARRRGDPRTED